MTIFLVLTIFLLVIILLAFLYLSHTLGKLTATKSASFDPESKTVDEITIFDWKSKGLIFLSLALLVLSFFTPFLLTKTEVTTTPDFTATGPIGDTIGGLMNPFIAMAGVIVTGLAFYIQFKANQLQRVLFQKQIDHQNDQVKLQQFESKFYEMLKLHRDNVTEMNIEGYDFRKTATGLEKFEKGTEGRKVFVTMKAELECILACFANGGKLNSDLFNKSYQLFFSGLDEFKKNHPAYKVFTGLLEQARERHQYPLPTVTTNEERKKFLTDANMNFNYKPFSGHASRLGHYFRHLYLIVKIVVQSNVISEYDEKMNYLKILRAQLSNHEQMLIFYNWLSGYGENWENDTNHFFTEYRMIHNLWYDNLMKNEFISDHVDVLRNIKVSHKDPIFEIDPVPAK
jgi:hypothetical protein